jgi:hypothetical protein
MGAIDRRDQTSRASIFQNVDQLVEVPEKVLETGTSGWVQRMENVLAQLKAEEEKEQAEIEKGEQSGGDKSQPENEGTPQPPQPDSVPPKEPADSPGQQDT